MARSFVAIFLAGTTLALLGHASAAEECLLRRNRTLNSSPASTVSSKIAIKPFPALTQCYKYNTEACCISGHDSTIADAYNNILSSTCLREYPDLELYYCIGCNPEQPKYVDEEKKELRICKSFAKKLFDKDPTKYDNCGLKHSTAGFILPSYEYSSSKTFLNDFKPPYFADYKIVVVDDGTNCLTSAARAIVASTFSVVLSVLSIVLLSM